MKKLLISVSLAFGLFLSSPLLSLAADTTPPTWPNNWANNVSVTNVTQTSITFSWSPATDNVGVVGYRLYRNNAVDGLPGYTNTGLSTSQNTITITGLTQNKLYAFSVVAYDAAGNESDYFYGMAPNTFTLKNDSQAPTVPSNLRASFYDHQSIQLNWDDSTDNVSVRRYVVKLDGSTIDYPSTNKFFYYPANPSTLYSFSVAAEDTSENVSAFTTPLAIKTLAAPKPDMAPPTTPGAMSQIGATDSTISMNWGASTDDTSVSGYKIYRDGQYVWFSTCCSYTDSNLQPQKTYNYQVLAYDPYGKTSALTSPVAMATINTPSTLTLNSATIDNATVKADGSSQYTITVSASDSSSGANISTQLALINYQGANIGQHRGYLGWSNENFPHFSNNYTSAKVCTGGGVGAIYNGPNASGFGYQYINLISCSTSVSGNVRTSSFVVSFNPAFTSPTSNNTISTYARNSGGKEVGWSPYGTFSISAQQPVAGPVEDDKTPYLWVQMTPKLLTQHTINLLNYDTPVSGGDLALNGIRPLNYKPQAGDYVAWFDYNKWVAAGKNTVPVVSKVAFTQTASVQNSGIIIDNPVSAGTWGVAYFNSAGKLRGISNGAYTLQAAAADTSKPTAPSNAVINSKTEFTTKFSWTASTDNVGVSMYFVRRGTSANLVNTLIGTPNVTNFSDSGLSPNTTYYYSIVAVDAANNASDGLNFSVTTNPAAAAPAVQAQAADSQKPTAPSSFVVTNTTTNSASFSWTASTDNVGVVGYRVTRDGAVVGNAVCCTFTDTNLSAQKTYSYYIQAYDAAGNYSDQSSVVPATTKADVVPVQVNNVQAKDTEKPSIPNGLVIRDSTASTITFSWTASTDNVGVYGYKVYRDGSPIVAVVCCAFTDSNLNPQTSYSYTIQAYDVAGNYSGVSTSAVGTTKASVVPVQNVVANQQNNLVQVVAKPIENQNQGVVAPVTSATNPVQGGQTTTKSLNIGAQGEEVRALQKLLNAKGFFVSQSGVGSPGNEGDYFGPATYRAVSAYIKANPNADIDITPYLSKGANVGAGASNQGGGVGGSTFGVTNPGAAAPFSGVGTSNSNASPVATSKTGQQLTRNLTIGSRGEDVRALQQFLNANGFVISNAGVGSPGNETTYFGPATARAVAKLQEAYKDQLLTPAGLSKGSGFVGKLTRDFINSR